MLFRSFSSTPSSLLSLLSSLPSARARHPALACSPPGPAAVAPLGLVRRGFPLGRSSDGARPQAVHTSWGGKELGGDGVGSGGARSELDPSPPEPAVAAPLGLGFPWGISTHQHASLLHHRHQSRRTSPSSSLAPLPRCASLPFRSNFILVSHVGLVGKRRCGADCSSQCWCW